ncbi:membrane protein insertase YidC [Corynebacterium sp. TAE3-ERU12]|uniref:membrane protein insertase YidC n=1 Tax=Corynebacterium sp. TAE3-ERU12 TaxID=2849491 RepID=UPI001C43856C|nr:membrane protein insertase YidC [Corynebacterium sp. TAE3-ERU12]MBV7296100.1 membrane protein insertase YidC [Corynebacterium sp. TAE3-ERU12]
MGIVTFALKIVFFPLILIGTIFAYPVSLLLRMWHWFFSDIAHLDASTAWILSILCLVAMVRIALLPLAYRAYSSGRKMVLLRPKVRALLRRYQYYGDPDAPKYLKWAREDLQRESGVNARMGCLMPLIQLPILLGLYRLIRMMSRAPANGEAPHSVAFLPADQVAEFIYSDLWGVPLSTYISMPTEVLARFDISRDEVKALAVPMILIATVLTTSNLIYSQIRSRQTLDRESAFSRRLFASVTGLAVVGALFPLIFGFFGPASIAVTMYWVTNNMWTTIQAILLTILVDRRMPLTDEFRDYSRKVRAERKALRRARRDVRAAARANELVRLRKVARMRATVVRMRPSEQGELPTHEPTGVLLTVQWPPQVPSGRSTASPGQGPGRSARR